MDDVYHCKDNLKYIALLVLCFVLLTDLLDSWEIKLHNEPAKVDLNNKMLSSKGMLCEHVLIKKLHM